MGNGDPVELIRGDKDLAVQTDPISFMVSNAFGMTGSNYAKLSGYSLTTLTFSHVALPTP
jgi:hypothetical protein